MYLSTTKKHEIIRTFRNMKKKPNKIIVLEIPADQRIGQYIYNIFRDREKSMDIYLAVNDKKHLEIGYRGIDIFDVSDTEFMKRINKGL